MRILAAPEGWPKYGQRWKREGEPTRQVLSVVYPGWYSGVYFSVCPFRDVRYEDWDEWMWWASDAVLQDMRLW